MLRSLVGSEMCIRDRSVCLSVCLSDCQQLYVKTTERITAYAQGSHFFWIHCNNSTKVCKQRCLNMVNNYQKYWYLFRVKLYYYYYYSGCGGFRTRLYMTPTTVIRWSLRQRLAGHEWSMDLLARCCSPRCRHTPCSSMARGTATAIHGRTLEDHIPRRRYYDHLSRSPAFVSRVR